MDIKEAVIEALKAVVLPELDSIKERIAVIEARLDGMDKRFEDMNRRFEDLRTDVNKRFEELRADVNKRFEELRADVNKRFDEQFNFNMKRFDSIEIQINNILAEIRELRRFNDRKVDMDEFRALENKYITLLTEVTLLKQKVA